MHRPQPKAGPQALQGQEGIERGCVLGGLEYQSLRADSGVIRGEPGKPNPHTLLVLVQMAVAELAVGDRVFLTQQPIRRVDFVLSSGHCPGEGHQSLCIAARDSSSLYRKHAVAESCSSWRYKTCDAVQFQVQRATQRTKSWA